jgi:hypothetical protein
MHDAPPPRSPATGKGLDAIVGYNFEAKQAPACYIEAMKPSVALDAHREEIRRIVAANRGRNPRVFGSVLHQDDTEVSDLDLLIDAAEGMTLFDKAAIEAVSALPTQKLT